ncbi:MAG: pitrilysin family protein [Planctomycetota bacterium]|nr:pitrilysin family protein [Planctomycetota bacterium]
MTTAQPTIHTRVLRCGAHLLVEPMPGMRSAAFNWLLPAGVATDPEDRQGLSAMLAEVLLRGSGERSSREMADAFDRLGASRSADAATIFFRVGSVSLGDRLHDVLPLLVDTVRRPTLDPEAIEPARDLCLQAIESLKDDPQERAALAARARHYAPPINRSPLGTREGIAAVTRDDLARHWNARAVPGNAILGFAGAVDPDALARTLNELLEGWTGAAKHPRADLKGPRGYGHETDQTNQVQIILMHDAPTEASPDALLEKILISVLSGGMSGRLFSEVREKRGLCYSVSASYRGDKDHGSVVAYVGTTPERAQQSLDVLAAELAKVRTPAGRVTPEEFRKAIVGFKSRLVFAGESTGARAASICSDFYRLGRARTLAEIAAQVDAVTLDQVNDYAARRSPGKLTIQTLGPAALTPASIE